MRNGLAVLAAAWMLGGAALAQEVTEKERLQQCEKDLCGAILAKGGEGDIACDLSKTWEKKDISDAAEKQKLNWALGSARCAIKIGVPRGDIGRALNDADYTLAVPKQTATCEVEREGERYPVSMTLTPTITFKNGEAVDAAVAIGDIEGSKVLTSVVWSVAKLNEWFGVFKGGILSETNKFITRNCPAKFGTTEKRADAAPATR